MEAGLVGDILFQDFQQEIDRGMGLFVNQTAHGGEGRIGMLRERGVIESFKFTSISKVEVIPRLIVAIEQQKVGWPEEWGVLTNELRRYEYDISPRGHLSYNAPSGFHDDCVIALAPPLAIRKLRADYSFP